MAVILVVEDEVFTREVAEMMIQDWGHDTLSASDGDEALLFLRSDRQIDALFTDIYLKNAVLGGCELAHQAIELRPDLRVLYTTGNFVTDKMKALVRRRHAFPSQALHAKISCKTPLKPCSQRSVEVGGIDESGRKWRYPILLRATSSRPCPAR